MVFALPGDPGLTELTGDFKIYFNDRQGDFYCWLNTTMMENRMILSESELDYFDKRKIPAPGFQVEIVMVDFDGSHPKRPASASNESDMKHIDGTGTRDRSIPSADSTKDVVNPDKDDVFSDSESEGAESSNRRHVHVASRATGPVMAQGPEPHAPKKDTQSSGDGIEPVSLKSEGIIKDGSLLGLKYEDNTKSTSVMESSNLGSTNVSEFKPVAADASVFSFGDEDEYESD